MSRPEVDAARSFARQNELLMTEIERLQEHKFYGRVTLEMCAGNIIQARIEKSWKLQEEADGIPSETTQQDAVPDQAAAASP